MSDYVEVRRDYRDWTPPTRPEMRRKESVSEAGSATLTPPAAAGDRHGLPDAALLHHANGSSGKQDGLEVISEKPAEEAS